MFIELESDRAAGATIADAVGSWWSLAAIQLLIAVWLGVNAAFQPFHPHPSTMIGYIGTVLTAAAALQGPLILLTQRRETARDRAREIETFRRCPRTEDTLDGRVSTSSTRAERFPSGRGSGSTTASPRRRHTTARTSPDA
ncbi:MAG: DUF1003 domain-containing protein [Pseudonocardia sp.]|nr:DUF1003 domain-containing protein [Pseudonocardia sp.]